MDKATALRLLESTNAHERLTGARFLAKSASEDDLDHIDRALRKENVSWIHNALVQALRRAQGNKVDSSVSNIDVEMDSGSSVEQQLKEIHSNALRETTSQLVHEIEPLLGTTRLYAAREIAHFEGSKTRKQLDLLASLLDAISELRKATGPAHPTDVELSALVRDICDQEKRERTVTVQLAGPSPFTVTADRARLWLAITNGLRNAIEASELVDGSVKQPIVINWNRTDRDFWVTIIDRGVGLKASADRILEIGSSTKKDHLGMGLPTAREAMMSMSGDIAISSLEDEGTAFEIRWPIFSMVPR